MVFINDMIHYFVKVLNLLKHLYSKILIKIISILVFLMYFFLFIMFPSDYLFSKLSIFFTLTQILITVIFSKTFTQDLKKSLIIY